MIPLKYWVGVLVVDTDIVTIAVEVGHLVDVTSVVPPMVDDILTLL